MNITGILLSIVIGLILGGIWLYTNWFIAAVAAIVFFVIAIILLTLGLMLKAAHNDDRRDLD
jgi:uncharacterized membrane protein